MSYLLIGFVLRRRLDIVPFGIEPNRNPKEGLTTRTHGRVNVGRLDASNKRGYELVILNSFDLNWGGRQAIDILLT